MKYALTHCYTDHNKGDAAIIISTVQLIRELDSNAQISMFSTFGPNDDQYKNEHEFIKPFSDNFFSGMFYQPRPVFAGSDISRVIHFLWITLKFSILLLTRNRFILRLFFANVEMRGIDNFLDSDLVISKGGSYITTQNKSIRQSLSLISMLFPFFLAKRYKKKIYIFSQSLGPVKGKHNQWLMRRALSGIEKIFLREDLCIKEYQEIEELRCISNIEIIPDTAFYMKNDNGLEQHPDLINLQNFNVGMTLVDHAFKYISNPSERNKKIETYINSIVDTIKHLIDTKDAYIHIFPQVISANSHLGHNDIQISKKVENIFKDLGLGNRVKYHYFDFNPMQLRDLYGEMNLFIGTRLHSVIFALSKNVPSINIAYHGTKSQGILGAIKGFESYVILIDDIYSDALIAKVDELYADRKSLKNVLKVENTLIKKQLSNAMLSILASCKDN